MKEAAGEANMTVVTIVLIAIVLGAGTLIVTNLMNSMGSNRQTRCSQIGGTWRNSACFCPGASTSTDVSGATATSCTGGTVTF